MDRVGHQHQMRQRYRLLREHGKREIRSNVAIDDQERFAPQQRERLIDASTGFQRLRFLRKPDLRAQVCAISQGGLDLTAQVRGVDDDFGDAARDQSCNQMFDQRAATRHEQWLGRVVGQGPHALTSPRRQNHGFHAASARRGSTRLSRNRMKPASSG